MVTVGYSRLKQVTEWLQWLQWDTAGYSRLPSFYSGLLLVTAGYRVVTVGYNRLPCDYNGLHQVTAGYRVVTVG